ncbi:TRAP transporter large permease [uncultured Cloacibacillus sp.]|uniref:TRAP transporter large permease n=1 Tax=uncultured Cloacibacillus sp. TaxID=889794 RepID=UPI0025FECFA1|nr:TRAP transporter large permease [uncultured Cloacibacillus sp.]
MIVVTLFASLAICLALTIPIAISLGISTVMAGFVASGMLGMQMLNMLAQTTITGSDSTSLLAMPFFMLVGTLMDQSGIAKKLINVAEAIVGEVSGGLATATIVAAMLFAAISGSGPAVVSALGGILIPAMVHRGYSNEYAAATVASAATIGPVIPPSIPMIVYAVVAGSSVTALFLGGVVPGIIMGLSLISVNYYISKKRGYHGVPRGGGFFWILKKIKEGILAIIMPVIVLGSIYAGIATPTESAVMGVMYTLVIGCFVFRSLDLKKIRIALVDAAMLSAPVMFLLGGASVFGRLLTLEHIPQMLAQLMLGMSDNRYLILVLIMLFLLVTGCFIDTTSNIVLFAPLFCPIITQLGYSLVYFGVLMTINLCIGFLTPPLGMNLFVAKNISGAPLGGIVKENMAYLIVLIVVLFICVICPPIITWLPSVVGN